MEKRRKAEDKRTRRLQRKEAELNPPPVAIVESDETDENTLSDESDAPVDNNE
ncbi:hypothetical protein [Stieleria varia]|uniref:Uncharacterized protein n=1 Tax=Stieleria varia TaxID=2528005 RepID=A0A5C6B0K3_9BACT|nr:hypothetical protein [Stieleria varia]TWU05101.1 hypothetical protein Pla52n_31470 [Stieleria varia]